MILKLSAIPLASIAILCGTMPVPVVAIQPIAPNPIIELRPDRVQQEGTIQLTSPHRTTSDIHRASKRHLGARIDNVRDDHTPQNRQAFSTQMSKGGEKKKPLLDQLLQQLTTKDSELATLREKFLIVNELLNVEKRHLESLETQLLQKEQELNALRDQGESESKAAKESDVPKSNFQQSKHKTDDFERKLMANNLENAKQRIGELILQLYAKESEIAALQSSAHENATQLRADLDSQTVELHQAKRRIAELEQQKAGGTAQDLAQAKRRITELEQQTVGKEQELTQAKRRMIEIEQQAAGKEQELAQAKRRMAEFEQQAAGSKSQDLAQAKRRITELEQQTAGKEQDLTQAKRRVTELEQQTAAVNPQELAQLKRRITELEQQTTGKEQDLAQAKQRITELEQQTVGKEQELTQAKRRMTEFEQQTIEGKSQDQAQVKRRIAELEQQTAMKEQELTQAKLRVTELEQPMAGGKPKNLAQAKRRIIELEQLTVGKEQELAQAKRRVTELEQQTVGKEQELTQAKRRVTDLEQQTAGKEQDLAQAKRRVTEIEQHKSQDLAQAKRLITEMEQQMAAGKSQDLVQAKRRITELEQLTASKEQELAKIKDDLLHVSRKFEVLNPQLLARTTELEQTKQLLADLQRNAFPLAEPENVPGPTLTETSSTNQQLIEADLPLPNLDRPSPTGADDDKAVRGTLSKETESLARLLQAELAKGSVAMRRRGNKLTLAFAAGELFSAGQAVMTPGGTSLLERVGLALTDFPSQSIEVAVLSDNTSSPNVPRKNGRNNTELSQTRAERATQALINGGVDIDRITAVGQAIIKPAETDDAGKDPRKNQKVEIMIVSESEPAARSKPTTSPFSKKPLRSTEKIVNR